jgi:ubiquinone/menaquinone biosynthesis C-methylase UbiE
MNSRSTFDTLAATYDDRFTNTTIGRHLRARVHARLALHFRAGDHVLELGCGTGEDALHLAQRGVRVSATDISERMLAVAQAKTAGNPLVTVTPLDLRALPHDVLYYDGAFSNFGALNVLDDWRPLALWLAQRVRPGGIVGFGVMSPFCLWELLWHGLHLDFATATRRLGQGALFQPDASSEAIAVHYPTIGRLTRDFAPWFRRVHISGLGLFLPPSDAFGVVEKRPRLLRVLMALEAFFAHHALFAPFADHYWIEFERVVDEVQ